MVKMMNKLYILLLSLLCLSGSMYAMDNSNNDVMVKQAPAQVDEELEEELDAYQEVKNSCFRWRRITGGLSGIGLYSLFSYFFPGTSVAAPLAVGGIGFGAAHFIKNNKTEAKMPGGSTYGIGREARRFLRGLCGLKPENKVNEAEARGPEELLEERNEGGLYIIGRESHTFLRGLCGLKPESKVNEAEARGPVELLEEVAIHNEVNEDEVRDPELLEEEEEVVNNEGNDVGAPDYAKAMNRVGDELVGIINKPGEDGGFKGVSHALGEGIAGGAGAGLKKNLSDPTGDRVKKGYSKLKEDLVKYGKHALWIIPAGMALYYALAIAKNQVEEYLNTPQLDVKMYRDENTEADGRVARDMMIFSSARSQKLRGVLESTKNGKIQSDYFKNVLLYGPPKSGKRMFADRLALYSHMDYCEIPWIELTKDKEGAALDRFFKKDVMNSKNGVVIYIDNAQMLFSSTTEMDRVISTLISHTQKPSTKYLVVFGIPEKPVFNNYNISVVDPYRIIEITLPAQEERLKLLRLYRDKYFDKLSEEVQQVLSEEALQDLARTLEGASAGEIAGFMKTLRNDSQLPTAEGLKEVFDELVDRSQGFHEDLLGG